MLGNWQVLGPVGKGPLKSALQHLHHVPAHLPNSQLQLEAGVHQGGTVVVQSLLGPPTRCQDRLGCMALTCLTPEQPLSSKWRSLC